MAPNITKATKQRHQIHEGFQQRPTCPTIANQHTQTVSFNEGLRRLLRGQMPGQMPSHNLLENALAACLDDISVTRDDTVEVPVVDFGNAVVKTLAVAAADRIPYKAFLAGGSAVGVVKGGKELSPEARCGRLAGFAKLLCSREVEHQIGLNKRLSRLVVEDQLFVGMGRQVRVLELRVEFGIHSRAVPVLGSEDDAEGHVFILLLGTLLRQAFWAEHFGLGVGGVP
jgi:hypothetical protein